MLLADRELPGRSRFGEAAGNYARSRLFAAGEDLGWLVAEARLQGTELVVDAGTGAGHAALALAPDARAVVGVDPEPAMLDQARTLAGARGVANVRFLPGTADELPLSSGSADLVVTRFAAHHFPSLDAALAEFRRILKPDGRLLVVDTISPPDPDADGFLHRIETLRDPSHIRDWSLAEWQQVADRRGIGLRLVRAWDLWLDFPDWVARLRTPPDAVAELERVMAAASPAIRESFAIAGDPVTSFCLKSCLLAGAVY